MNLIRTHKRYALVSCYVIIATLLVALLPVAQHDVAYAQSWLSGWAKRVKLTIDQTDIDAVLSNYPIMVYLSTSSGRLTDDVSFVFDELASDANRKKIAVTTDDGTTQCYVEIEKWDDANEHAWLWVKVPSVAADVDTSLYLYYDSTHADNTDYVGDTNSTQAETVWDSYYQAVYHMTDGADTSHIYDSTANNRDGTKGAAANPAVNTGGQTGSCMSFDGGDYITLGTGYSPIDNFMVQAVVKPTATTKDRQIISKGYNGTNTQWELKPVADDGKPRFQTWVTPNGYGVTSTTAMSTSVFKIYHGAISTTTWSIFANGTDKQTSVATGPVATSQRLLIGAVDISNTPGQFYSGLIDEVRISSVIRADAWVKADYETGRDHLLDFSNEEVDAPTIISFTPTSAGSGASVVITGTNFTGATAVKFGGTDASGFTVNFPTQITAVVGSGSTGTISVTTPGDTATSADTFTYEVISISVSPPGKDWGIVGQGQTLSTATTYFTVTNNGTVAVDISIHGADTTCPGGTPWTLSNTATPGSNIYGLKFWRNVIGNWTTIPTSNVDYMDGLAASGTDSFGLQLLTPTSITDTTHQQTGVITLTAVKQ